ncbi:MAG: ATP-binding protein [Sphingobacteriia bacterium]|jgi:ATP-dependent DNA helicase RecG
MPESHNIEYKQNWHDDYLKWVCGFANAVGGIIYIGKDDAGKVVGVAEANRLSIWNEGTLPMGLSLDDLRKEHTSHPRNPIIADACFKAGYIDSWGRGTLKIIEACKAAGLPEPEIRAEQGGMRITLHHTLPGLGDGLGDRLGDSQAQILQLIQQNPAISIPEMAQHIGISTTAIEKNLKTLKDQKRIQRTGTPRKGYWQIIPPKKPNE